jgi:uncharacterized protein with FMN-binding domain
MTLLKRIAFLFLGSISYASVSHAALLVQGDGSTAAPIDQQSVVNVAMKDGSFVGGTYDAYYGTVQVQATVQGGRITAVKALKFPNHSGTSRSINRQALPYLLQEVVAKQSARINIISGATLTSRAYIASLRDALKNSGQ